MMRGRDWFRAVILFAFGLQLYACATTKDTQMLNREMYRQELNVLSLQREIESLRDELRGFQRKTETDSLLQRKDLDASQKEYRSQLAVLSKEVDVLRNDLMKEIQSTGVALKQADETIKEDMAKIREDLVKETKKSRADFLARLDGLQSEVRALAMRIEEYHQLGQSVSKEVELFRGRIASQLRLVEERIAVVDERERALEKRGETFAEAAKALEERLKGVEERYTNLENTMRAVETKQAEREVPAVAKEGTAERDLSLTVVASVYKAAYAAFQKGDLEGAQTKFDAFVKQYPHTQLSDNARFWIGEIYYQKKDFEKAILEYEKVIVKYPEGDKVPHALFKQALAFLELGDRTNGRNLLRRVIEQYPQFEQIEEAKKKLESIQ